MKKFFALNENGFIVSTTDLQFPQEGQEIFDFPADFDFAKQSEYKIVNGELVNATDEAEERQEREYWQSIPYDDAVNAKIRERYTESQEFAILRQKDEKPTEYNTYYAYCEECKAFVKMMKAKYQEEEL